jgi:glutaminase
MKSKNAFPEGTDIDDVVEFYTQCCSMESDSNTLSIIAATLANGGVCPLNGERVLSSKTVQNCLSLMNCCGMNDFSGQFAYKVGLPAKSGVSGGIMLVVPGKMGIVSYSPLLDNNSNSVRGVKFCDEMSERLQYHIFQKSNCVTGVTHANCATHTEEDLIHFCAIGDLASVKRLDFVGCDLDQADYDGRTPLHLAASNGHYQIVKYLLESGLKNLNSKDRHKNTPMDDAKIGKHSEIHTIIG